jgi:hypothetical protein
MIARRLSASGVTRAPDPAEPDAKAAYRAMAKRKVDASKVKRGTSPTDPGPKPPTSKSFASAEAEGDDEEGEEGEEDAAASRKRMIDKKFGRAK